MTATAGKTLLDSMLRSQARAPCARRISSTSSSSSSSSSSRRSSSSPTVQTSRSWPAIAHGQRPPYLLASSAPPLPSSSRPSVLASSACRAYATASSSSPVSATRAQSSGVRVGTLFLALSILGIGATSIGLYDYFTSLQTWPKELRTELRAALRSKSRQDYVHAHKNFRKAWEKALSPEFADQLGLLKITGIGIAWAEMLEEAARRADEGSITNARTEAYEVLAETFNWAREKLNADTNGVATPQQRLRGVAIAVKLADTAEGQRELDSQTEEQLTWAVEEVLRVTQAGAVKPEKSSVDSGVLVGELELPSWVTKSDIGATLESLGNLYARKGNVEYAMPLYLQSISLLLPPAQAKKPEPSVGDKCHAATIMNNLSSLIASAPTAPSTNIPQGTQAFAWASKASQIAKAAIASASELDTEVNTCKPVLTVALYNLGMLRLMEGDKQGAKGFLDEAKAKAKEWGLKDAEFRAAEVIKSL